MRKFLFAFLALTACADDHTPPNDDGTGGDNGGGGGDDDGGGGGGDDDGGGGGGGGDDGTDDVNLQQDLDDVAATIGANLAFGELSIMIDSINMAYGRMPSGFTVMQGPDFQMVNGTRGELEIQYKLFCRDTADLYAPCDGFEDHAHVHVLYSGRLAASSATMDGVERKANWIVRDFAMPTPRVGGDGTDVFASKLATGDYLISVSDTLNRVRFEPSPTLPVGGSINLQANVQRTRATATPADRTFNVGVQVDFAGGDSAVITLDGEFRYNLTLSTGAVTR